MHMATEKDTVCFNWYEDVQQKGLLFPKVPITRKIRLYLINNEEKEVETDPSYVTQ